ncbi:MAG: AMP-binding protein [Gammaproteobacteria bacterium]|nr:AMP-binding protein [Gammaproteobacteria bacterium]
MTAAGLIRPSWSLGQRETPVAALARAVAVHPGKVFLDFSGGSTSYREFDHLSNALAHSLRERELGVTAGVILVSLLDNSLDAVLLWFGMNKLGALTWDIEKSTVKVSR